MTARYRIIVYACMACEHKTVTKPVDPGVTPLAIHCPKCNDFAYDLGGTHDPRLRIEYEWRSLDHLKPSHIASALQKVLDAGTLILCRK